ncbi:hypothetical protein diail_2635 [Diaporthe ilicicola]|nr:hypothetical protein diail_2635 [Diaporthe ilicicola]
MARRKKRSKYGRVIRILDGALSRPDVLESPSSASILVQESGKAAPKVPLGAPKAPILITKTRDLSAAECRKRRLVSASVNINLEARKAFAELEMPFQWVCICPPPWAVDRGEVEDTHEDSDKENEHPESRSLPRSTEDNTICDSGKTCICTKPANANPKHPWIITRAGYLKWTASLNMVPLRCPEVFGMDISSDHEAYGMLEIIKNLIADYRKAMNLQDKWMVCEALIMFLLGPGLQFSKSVCSPQPVTRISDGDRAEEAARLICSMLLDLLAHIEFYFRSERFLNLGLILSLYIRFSEEMRQCDLLTLYPWEDTRRRSDTPESIRSCSDTQEYTRPCSDPPEHFFSFDDYIRGYARKFNITLRKLDGLEPLQPCSGNDVGADKTVLGNFDCAPRDRARWSALYPYNNQDPKTGGDEFDFTTWSSADRARHSLDGEDPLNAEEIDALKSGKTMQTSSSGHAPGHVVMLIQRRFNRFGGVVEKHDVMVATSCRVSTPFRAGEDDHFSRSVGLLNDSKCLLPSILGDVEIVGSITDDVQASYLLGIGNVIRTGECAYSVVRVYLKVSVQYSRDIKIPAHRDPVFVYLDDSAISIIQRHDHQMLPFGCQRCVWDGSNSPNAYQIENVTIGKIKESTRPSPPSELEDSKRRLWKEPRPSKNVDLLPSLSQDSRPLLRDVAIDVRGVNHIDVTGTQALHDLKVELQYHAGKLTRFVFVGMTPDVKDTLERTGWALVNGGIETRSNNTNQGSVGLKGFEGYERVRDGGDVVFKFIHSTLYEASMAGPQ